MWMSYLKQILARIRIMPREDFSRLSREEQIARTERLNSEEEDKGLVPQFVSNYSGESEPALKTHPIFGGKKDTSGATREASDAWRMGGVHGTLLAQDMAALMDSEFNIIKPEIAVALRTEKIDQTEKAETNRIYKQAYAQELTAQNKGLMAKFRSDESKQAKARLAAEKAIKTATDSGEIYRYALEMVDTSEGKKLIDRSAVRRASKRISNFAPAEELQRSIMDRAATRRVKIMAEEARRRDEEVAAEKCRQEERERLRQQEAEITVRVAEMERQRQQIAEQENGLPPDERLKRGIARHVPEAARERTFKQAKEWLSKLYAVDASLQKLAKFLKENPKFFASFEDVASRFNFGLAFTPDTKNRDRRFLPDWLKEEQESYQLANWADRADRSTSTPDKNSLGLPAAYGVTVLHGRLFEMLRAGMLVRGYLADQNDDWVKIAAIFKEVTEGIIQALEALGVKVQIPPIPCDEATYVDPKNRMKTDAFGVSHLSEQLEVQKWLNQQSGTIFVLDVEKFGCDLPLTSGGIRQNPSRVLTRHRSP